MDALTALALARIRETARLPRRGRGGRMESATMAQARGAVDLAIIGVMADGGLRRSEAAALTWSQAKPEDQADKHGSEYERRRDETERIPAPKGNHRSWWQFWKG